MDRSIAILRTVAAVAFVACTLLVLVLSLMPGQEMPDLGIWDKAEHFAAYAGLGGLGALAFWHPRRPSVLRLLVFLWLLGVGLEVAQAFSPGRSPDAADAFANGIGACLGIVLLRSVLLPLYLAGRQKVSGNRPRS